MSRVFDMFYRAINFSEGSGIGLYILKETLESLDGKVELESKFREFTKISIYFRTLIEKIKYFFFGR